MKEDELIKEAEHALQELEKKRTRKEVDKLKGDDTSRRNLFSYLLALILLLLLIMMVVPFYAIKLNPEPKNIPSPSEVMIFDVKVMVNTTRNMPLEPKGNYLQLLMPDNNYLRNMAAKIVTASCKESDICYAKALFYFVRDNYQYVADPPSEYLEGPFETIYMGGADCDGMSILLANLELAAGIPTRFVFVPGHVYVQVKVDSAPRKYKQKDGWISLDPTCKNCEFGEETLSSRIARKDYLYT